MLFRSSVSWDIYRIFFFFCHRDSVSYLSLPKVESLQEIYKTKSGKNERETSAMEQLIKYFT